MNEKTLTKIEDEIRSLYARSANIRDRELVSVAKRLGRYRWPVGKEPTYVSDVVPGPPITIPCHTKHKTLKQGTARNILAQLENDIFYLREQLSKEG